MSVPVLLTLDNPKAYEVIRFARAFLDMYRNWSLDHVQPSTVLEFEAQVFGFQCDQGHPDAIQNQQLVDFVFHNSPQFTHREMLDRGQHFEKKALREQSVQKQFFQHLINQNVFSEQTEAFLEELLDDFFVHQIKHDPNFQCIQDIKVLLDMVHKALQNLIQGRISFNDAYSFLNNEIDIVNSLIHRQSPITSG